MSKSSASSPARDPLKAQDIKRRAEAKLLAERVKRVFYTPFSRMMRFLYTGMSSRPDVLMVGTNQERNFRYGDPDQGLGFVHLKPGDLRDALTEWFAQLGINSTRCEVVNLLQIGAVLNRCKWEMSKLTMSRDAQDCLILTEEDGVSTSVSEPIDSYFMFEKIRQLTQAYQDALVDKIYSVIDHPHRGDDEARMCRVVVMLDPTRHVRVLLTRGLDWLTVKSIPFEAATDFLGLRLWSQDTTSYTYLHTLDTMELILGVTRCNFFLIPRATPPTPPIGV